MKILNFVIFSALLVGFACKKDIDYTIYYNVEIQPFDYSKSCEANIDYINSEGKHINQILSSSEWNGNRYARSDENAFLRVQGTKNIALINITVTINGKKYAKTCNTLNCWVEINESLN